MTTVRQLRARLDEIAEEHDDYLHGRCVVFAVALHRLSNLPLYGITGFDEDLGKEVLIHAYVRLDDRILIDVRGPRAYVDMFQDFIDDDAALDADEARFSIAVLSRLGTGSSRCPSLRTVMPVAEEVWTIAQELIARGAVPNVER